MDHYQADLDHEQLLVRRGTRSGLFTIVAIHSTARGPALGGCRMWTYDDSRSAIRDALRLSRAMTFKSAVAGLPLGGGKGVIMRRPQAPGAKPLNRNAVLRDFGETVEACGGRYITAEDVGTSSRDMQVIAERTKSVCGLSKSKGGSGDPSPWTALGVEVAIRASCERVFGSGSLKGRTIALIGLGRVGSRLAARCAKGGAKLLLADLDPAKKALAKDLGARWVSPEDALLADVDVLAPCALGGLLDPETIPKLRCRIVAGAANNQLAEDRDADLLSARGILWAPDFVANAGGVINISAEVDGTYDTARARARVKGIGDTLDRIFSDASAIGATPLTTAMELARQRLAEAAVA